MSEGQVVKIISSRHKYFGEEAVIQWSSSKMYMIRLLHKKKPLFTRFLMNRNKLQGTLSSQIAFYIKMSSVKVIKGKKANPQTNTWQKETSNLIRDYGGMTKTEIERKIGHKLVHWDTYSKKNNI